MFKVILDKRTIPNKAKLRASMRGQVGKAINGVMREVFAETQELVPVDTGALLASGVFTPADESGATEPLATISYGNEDVDYALIVHEDLEAVHAPPTQAKYVETPVAQNSDRLQEAIRKATIMGVRKGWKN